MMGTSRSGFQMAIKDFIRLMNSEVDPGLWMTNLSHNFVKRVMFSYVYCNSLKYSDLKLLVWKQCMLLASSY